jgi:hypothetical protein
MLAEVGSLVEALKYCAAATHGLKHFKGAAAAPHLKHALSHAMQVRVTWARTHRRLRSVAVSQPPLAMQRVGPFLPPLKWALNGRPTVSPRKGACMPTCLPMRRLDQATLSSLNDASGVLNTEWMRVGAVQLEERIREHLQGTGQEAALRGLGAGSGNWLGGWDQPWYRRS